MMDGYMNNVSQLESEWKRDMVYLQKLSPLSNNVH